MKDQNPNREIGDRERSEREEAQRNSGQPASQPNHRYFRLTVLSSRSTQRLHKAARV